jgi:hypothetical protein
MCRQKKINNNSGRGNSNTGSSNNGGNGNNYQTGNKTFNGVCHYCKKTGHREKDCFKKKKDVTNGETAAVAALGNGNDAAEMMCLGFEIFNTEEAYEEVPSMEECPNLVGCCMFCNTVGPAYAVCLTCPPEARTTYHPLTITRYQTNDARTQDKELADLVVTRLMSSKVDEELEAFFGLVGQVLYKGIDPDNDAPTFYVRDRMEIAARCNMQDVPDVMARSYRYIHEKIDNLDSEIIHVTLVEYKLILDIGTMWLMHRYR